ncbi:MAG: 3-dehydroquinate synthase [Clostridia bacterium]|nr:3-dehydroquinate synthase [Clostridia bacterium]
MAKLHLNLGENSYDVIIGKNLLNSANKYFNLNRKVLIVTDDGVPTEYSEAISKQCKTSKIVSLKSGEGSKSVDGLSKLYQAMIQMEMDRTDCIVAVGGGVVGDLAGFVASSYMRGIDFYNVPTTLLSQVDSSIGGKTAINFGGVKNIVGAFYQPKCVLVDTDTLKTLPQRQISNGLAEAVKMSLTSDKILFEKLEKLSYDEILNDLESIITASLKIKQYVVEQDEKEAGLRKILNFGHTFGHAIEAQTEMQGMFHGECVALGMLPMSSVSVRERLVPVLKKLNLPVSCQIDIDEALNFVCHDKKCANGFVNAIFVDKIGEFEIKKLSISDFCGLIKGYFAN